MHLSRFQLSANFLLSSENLIINYIVIWTLFFLVKIIYKGTIEIAYNGYNPEIENSYRRMGYL